MAKSLLLLICFVYGTAHGQEYFLRGRITNTRLEPLAFATIQVKELQRNLQSKQDGSYELLLPEGKFDLIVSMIGHRTQTATVIINKKDAVQNFLLEEEKRVTEEEALVMGQRKDRALEYIRNVIRHKDDIQRPSASYSATVYIKAVQEVVAPMKKSNRKNNLPPPDSATWLLDKMAMAEIQLQVDRNRGRIKETRNGVKTRGNPESLFFLSTTQGDFNLYDNLLQLPGLSTTPFVSPLSYSGLIAYRYKTIKIRKDGNRTLYTISFRPGKLGNALLDGELEIMDSAWVMVHARYTLPAYHIAEYDQFAAEQFYAPIADTAWLVERQQFVYKAKNGKQSASGVTTATYTNYELNKVFPKKHFGLELSSTAQQAYERDSAFWETVRPEPLTEKELRFIRYKDSVYQATHTKYYLDSIDARTNRITAKKIILDGITFYNRAKERRIEIGPVANLFEPFQPGGGRIGYNGSYTKTFTNKKFISAFATADYGIRNKDLNGQLQVVRLYNPFNRGSVTLNLGRSFDYLFEGDVLINSFRKSNLYRKYNLSIGHNLELVNGLYLDNELELAYRQSLAGLKFFDWPTFLNRLTKDSAQAVRINQTNTPLDFAAHSVFYNNITLSYTPFQRYMREPHQKVVLGSRWPTFSVKWRKGIPGLLGSIVDYDYVEFKATQTLQLGTVGLSRYTLQWGNFLNRTNIQQADKKFIRGRDPYLFFSPEFNFQHIDSTFELRRNFLEGHYVHEFNGAILNKIPLLKKLRLREIAGGGILYAPERDLRYIEFFAGIESPVIKLFRERFKLGVFVVGSLSNRFSNPVQLKFSIRQWDRRQNRWL